MQTKRILIAIVGIVAPAAATLLATDAVAQDAPAQAGGNNDSGDTSGANGAQNGGPNMVVVPGPTTTTTTSQTYPGILPPAGWDPNGHLPQSSRAVNDINGREDGFDLARPGAGAATARGGSSSSYVVEGQFVPDAHTVRRGDTLWDISGQFYRNPYNWPRLWAINPQIQNPHWIYPGDRVRLQAGGAGNTSATAGGIGLNRRRAFVPPDTVFLRDVGWIDDEKDDVWGELVGSPSDHMMLSEGNEVYIEVGNDHEIAIGQELTVFRPLHDVATSGGGKGTLVSIRGTVRIDRYNPQTHVVRAEVIEAVDVIERGIKVGPVGRRFDVVAPTRNEKDLEVRIIAAVYPLQIYGQNQVVFVDKGGDDGLAPGNRLFAISEADPWRATIVKSGSMAQLRPMIEDDRPARVQPLYTEAHDDLFPDETYAELRVIRVRAHTAACLITASTHEIDRGARLVARKGY